LISKKGQILKNFYVILDGEVELYEVNERLQVNEYDQSKFDKISETKLVKILRKGDYYGQFGCFYNTEEKYQIQAGNYNLHLGFYTKQS
jgi:CRP-like cAMP-binding protein